MMIKQLKNTIIFVGMLSVSSWAWANEYFLTEQTYRALEQAHTQMEEGQYSPAESALLALLEKTTQDYDRAVILQTLGYLYSETDKLPRAAQRFEEALALNALPEDIANNLRFNLAQLKIADGQYQSGINLINQWIQTAENVQPTVYVLLANAHYQLNQFTKTVENIRLAISRSNAPQESWYRLQLGAHMEMQQYDAAIKVLETLITRFAYNRVYWDQLAALYAHQSKPMASLSVQMLIKRLDTTDTRTMERLINLYRYLNIPYKAAQLFEESFDKGTLPRNFDNLDKLAETYLQAREYQRAAIVLTSMRSMDASGKTDLKLSRLYVGQAEWSAAEQALTGARDKLSGEDLGEALLLSGMAEFNLDDYVAAQSYFQRAEQYQKHRNQARQWIGYMERLIAQVETAAAADS